MSQVPSKGNGDAGPAAMRVHFIANGVYKTSIAGGDIHFLEIARAVLAAGYRLHFFGGHALEAVLRERLSGYDYELTLTDKRVLGALNEASLRGQLRLFWDDLCRCWNTWRKRQEIRPDEVVYAVTDYWFDVIPAVRSSARLKMMVWHMHAPGLAQILRRSRPDVDRFRIAATHYWLSQNLSLRLFRRCPSKVVFHVHPDMRSRLLRLGYREEELSYSPFGMPAELPNKEPAPEKRYDVVWIGRVHRQKGIEDLLVTLRYLAKRIPDFRGVLIGNLKAELEPRLKQLGLEERVTLAGFVSEEEKYRLFRASRVFLMPSRFEGSPRVIGEALLCRVPTVAYEVETYRSIFGELVEYVPAYDLAAFQRAAERAVLMARKGELKLDEQAVARFCRENSWETVCTRFLERLPGRSRQ